eukprot:CAMPEP_0196659288 /NCGR_PEP_ID=MMETSP1086-20130531/34175_1 /TAXON_ID=77921 /ORGANISM="Cyanoptyche  gloeocystis , Strain SAG4.97" /LENGTH=165 /DNA_ID=CAMNT_0041993197 /DNA_START=165 /DNA_END=662 /DNA_ORIENTATION=+
MQRILAVLCLTTLTVVPAFAAFPTPANIQTPLTAALSPGGAGLNVAMAALTPYNVPPAVAQQVASAAAGSFGPVIAQMALNAATAAQTALGAGRGPAPAIADAESQALVVAMNALPYAEGIARNAGLAGGLADPVASNAARAAVAALLGHISCVVGSAVGNAIAA